MLQGYSTGILKHMKIYKRCSCLGCTPMAAERRREDYEKIRNASTFDITTLQGHCFKIVECEVRIGNKDYEIGSSL